MSLFAYSALLAFLITAPSYSNATEWPNIFGLLPSEEHYELKLLGKFVFFDPISVDQFGQPADMSCSSCHDPRTGGTGPDPIVNLTQVAITGANTETVGVFKPPTNQYAPMIPAFHGCNIGGVRDSDRNQFCGGNFYNGRSIGFTGVVKPGSTTVIDPAILGSHPEYAVHLVGSADQALNPFPSDNEQNVPDGDDFGQPGAEFVCRHVASAKYAVLYTLAWGEPINCDGPDVVTSFKRIAVAVSAYQASNDQSPFTSLRDFALRAELMCVENSPFRNRTVCRHPDYTNSPGTFPLVGVPPAVNRGHDLFYNTCFPRCGEVPFPDLPVTNCSFCHTSDTEHPDGTGVLERYADDAYHNIGTPINRELPAAAQAMLGDHLADPAANGGVRTATVRNVDKRPYPWFVKAYAHNGYFKSLEGIVHFYNTSQVKVRCEDVDAALPPEDQIGLPYTEAEALAADCWPAAEWPDTVSTSRLVGNIGMTAEQEADLVAYMRSLTDYSTARPPTNFDILLAILKNR